MLAAYTTLNAVAEAENQRLARDAMGLARQHMNSAMGMQTCGAKLTLLWRAFYQLGVAKGHVEAMGGDMSYAMSALFNVLRKEMDDTWRQVRAGCRL